MTAPIKAPFRPISPALQDLINERNWRVDFTWRVNGSNCKAFQKFTPSTVPAAAVSSRVPAVERSGLILEKQQ